MCVCMCGGGVRTRNVCVCGGVRTRNVCVCGGRVRTRNVCVCGLEQEMCVYVCVCVGGGEMYKVGPH